MIDMELARQALHNTRSLGARTNLTVLGIVIGIAAIISLVSLGNSLNASVSEQFQMLGTNTLMVLPGKSFAASAFSKLGEDDVKKIEAVKGVDFASEIYLQTKQVEMKNQKRTTLVVGVDASKLDKLSISNLIEIEKGSSLNGKSFDALVGKNFAEDAFSKPLVIGETVKMEGKSFKIVGILKKSSNFYSRLFSNALIVDKEALKQTSSEKILPARIYVNLAESSLQESTRQRIFSTLKKAHGEEDFQLIDTRQIAQTASSVIGTIQLVLVAIAAISLLVGGIGVMNAMFTSVTERTKEIGIMKAIGATNSQVMEIFIAETAIIGFFGGVIGVMLGFAVAYAISISSEGFGFALPFRADPLLALFGIAFAVTVSIASGYLPAVTAAKLDPVEALRFE